MNKKILIAILVIAVVLVVIGVIFYFNKPKTIELNLEVINTNFSSTVPFNEMPTMEVDSEVLSSTYQITDQEYVEVIGKMPMMNIQASMYLVIKAKDGMVDSVKEKVDEYAKTQENIWSTYLPEQYDLVLQRKTGVVGNYVYLIIGENAEEMEKLLINN